MADSARSGRYPSSLSPSRASDFTSCPLLYRFRAIDRLPEAPSAAAVRGTLVHRALELLFGLPAEERTPAAAAALVESSFAELERHSPDEADALRPQPGSAPVLDVDRLLSSYFTLEDPRRLEPHAREVAVSGFVDEDLELRGYVDRVDRTPDGLVRIVDYKTGRSPSESFAAKAMFQMRFYALVWWRMTGEIPALLQLMYLGDGQVLRHAPDADGLLATERRLVALADAIGRAADTEFTPRPSRLCDWCSHRSLCPAWDGVPPPLPPREEWPTAMTPQRGRDPDA